MVCRTNESVGYDRSEIVFRLSLIVACKLWNLKFMDRALRYKVQLNLVNCSCDLRYLLYSHVERVPPSTSDFLPSFLSILLLLYLQLHGRRPF